MDVYLRSHHLSLVVTDMQGNCRCVHYDDPVFVVGVGAVIGTAVGVAADVGAVGDVVVGADDEDDPVFVIGVGAVIGTVVGVPADVGMVGVAIVIG